MIETPTKQIIDTDNASVAPDCSDKKQEEYSERQRFWSDKSIQQLSFSNNLLLTIAIAAIGYFFGKREKVYKKLIIDNSLPIDLTTTLFVVGSMFIGLSILGGILLALTRLYGFRLSRHISLTRKRACKAGKLLNDERLRPPPLRTAICDIFYVFFKYENVTIYRQEYRTQYKIITKKFKVLRKLSLSFDKATWFLLNFQFVLFTVGILMYVIVTVIM